MKEEAQSEGGWQQRFPCAAREWDGWRVILIYLSTDNSDYHGLFNRKWRQLTRMHDPEGVKDPICNTAFYDTSSATRNLLMNCEFLPDA